jgi:hypothetical protein
MEVSRARPISSMLLGLLFGIALAVVLQQAGVWPLDKLTTFLLPGLAALIFVLVNRIGRETAMGSLVVALIVLVAPIAYGLTGIGELNENGQLNGGCTVEAASDIDTTIVTDSSRSAPFDIEPTGGLSWLATSPWPITDHVWEIWVVVGDFEYVVADGGDPNDDMDVVNAGDVPSVLGYIAELGFRSGEQIQGVYEVGGFIDGDGRECDGFGFVRIRGPFLGTLIYWIAFILALLALILYLLMTFTGRRGSRVEGFEADATDVAVTSAGVGGADTSAGRDAGLGGSDGRDDDNRPQSDF